MPTTLELCEKYFQTTDIYELLGVTKNSIEKDIKKAYYKLSLQVHPDRVSDDEKEIATEKFKLLGKIYSILSDKNKKALYDEQGIIDDEDDNMSKLSSWIELWKQIFKPITTEDIDNFQKGYIGSELELTDIKRAYLGGKGCINYLMDHVPFMTVEDEPRIQEIVKKLISNDEVPDYKQFTNEPSVKRNRRHKKYAKESKEASIIKEKLSKNGGSLEQQILKRQSDRQENMTNFFDKLMDKYGGGADDEEYELPPSAKQRRIQQKEKTKTAKPSTRSSAAGKRSKAK